jgi:hypothetical protein
MWRCWKDVARAYLRFFLSSPAYRQVGAEGTLMRRDPYIPVPDRGAGGAGV